MEGPRRVVRSPEALGDELARRRATAGLTQDELAGQVGLTRRYLYSLESGDPNLYARRLFEVLRALDLHLEVVPNEAAGRRPRGTAS